MYIVRIEYNNYRVERADKSLLQIYRKKFQRMQKKSSILARVCVKLLKVAQSAIKKNSFINHSR